MSISDDFELELEMHKNENSSNQRYLIFGIL